MFWNNVINGFNSIRFRLALYFSVLFLLFALLFLSGGYYLLKKNLIKRIDSELSLAAGNLKQVYFRREDLDDDEEEVFVAQLPNAVNVALKRGFHRLKILRIIKKKEENDIVYEIKGFLNNDIQEIEIDANGKLLKVETKSAANARKRLKNEFRKEADKFGSRQIGLMLFSQKGKLLLSCPDNRILTSLDVLSKTSSPETVYVEGENQMRILPITLFDKSKLVVYWDLNDIQRVLDLYVIIYSSMFAVAILLVSIISFFIANNAMGGIRRVARAAQTFGTGKLDVRVPLKNDGNEIIALINIFNIMADQLQALIREQREITDNIAHDLRTPLTRIRGTLETAVSSQPDQKAYRQMAAELTEECDNLTNMINSTLEISQAEAGLLNLNIGEFDLKASLEKSYQLFTPLAEAKRIQLQLELPHEEIKFTGDKSRIQRVVANLLDNAIKYSRKNDSVSLSLNAADGNLLIIVKDTSGGISPDEQKHIFTRFYRGDHSRTQPGNGLGLSLAMAFVKAHNGNLTVSSVMGEGSTFTIKLPVSNRYPS